MSGACVRVFARMVKAFQRHQSFVKATAAWQLNGHFSEKSPSKITRRLLSSMERFVQANARHKSICSSSRFHFVDMSPVICYSAVRQILLFSSIAPCFWVFSLHFSSSSAFLRMSLRTVVYGLPRFLHPPYCFVSALFGNLSPVIQTMCPTRFILLLPILPTVQLYSSNFFS